MEGTYRRRAADGLPGGVPELLQQPAHCAGLEQCEDHENCAADAAEGVQPAWLARATDGRRTGRQGGSKAPWRNAGPQQPSCRCDGVQHAGDAKGELREGSHAVWCQSFPSLSLSLST